MHHWATGGKVSSARAETLAELSVFTAGATPVLIEGPMDAIAMSIAAGGEYVGIAPLGTAFTESQARKLSRTCSTTPAALSSPLAPTRRLSIGSAGLLAGRGAPREPEAPCSAGRRRPRRPRRPREIVRTEGPAALSERLANPTNFTTELIDRLVDGRLEGHSDAFPRVDLARDLARIIGALPPYEWIEHARRLAERLDQPRATISQEAFEAGTN